ncbi:MAG TPA: winged helix-turn-helix domain-containing protein [Vicinamibacterales bacterium]|nr:winged helix-turn-helix domain-containing protein [Vicinamibacterales bacterium]
MTFHFGPFTLDAAAYRITREGTDIELSPKLIDLLLYLVRRPSTLITKEELFEAIWPDVTVTENALTRAVSEVRQALGDDSAAPTYIQTVARRGYRFIAPVTTEETGAAAAVRPLGVPAAQSPRRETPSLEAFRQLAEGRLHLESLDAPSVPAAIAHFERAIALDPHYALAHVGLASARFWAYELSRERNVPDSALLATAIGDARRAVELDPHLAEAHATLSFMLVSAGRLPEAQREAARAIELEPGYWGHYFRLGHASWGEARLQALHSALELYPDFAFAHFEIAMVATARGRLEQAEAVLREGIVVLERQVGRRERFPASGLHWMLGLVRLARGDAGEAEREFDAEIRTAGDRLYAREFTLASLNALGAAAIRTGAFDRAIGCFTAALACDGDHARTCVGLSLALTGAGQEAAAAAAAARARSVVEALARGPRIQEATLLQAVLLAAAGHPDGALQALVRLVTGAPPGFTGWTIPIEPLLEPVRQLPGYAALAASLAARAS